MQIDRWTVDADGYSDGENNVNFSVWIDPVGQQHMSASYFNQEKAPQEKMNPITPTPIPPRASAPGVVNVRPRYPHSYTLVQEEDVTRIPTLPQPIMWQYDSTEYQAESSLSSLSLVVPEMASKDKERRYVTPHPHPAIEDLKTAPPAKKGKQQKPRQQKKKLQLPMPRAIYDMDTVPPQSAKARKMSVSLPGSGRALSTLRPQLPLVPAEEGDLRSWTAGGGANSIHARRIASEDRRAARFNPLDRMRWWLLWPGRIEFLLWFAGTITLMVVTCIFLFATIVSFGVINPGGSSRTGDTPSSLATSTTGNTPCTTQSSSCSNAQTPGKTPLLFSLITLGPLTPGMSLKMKGQGFSPRATVTFTHDDLLPCEPPSQQTDTHGSFIVEMQLGLQWAVGKHVITAYDTSSKRLSNATITILPGTFGKSTTPTGTGTALPTTPVPGIPPTSVAGGGQPNPLPTPVGQYPVTPTPTSAPATPTATATQTPPTPTPTVGVQPTPTQLPKPTPTVGKGKVITPTPGNSSITPSQVTALNANATYSTLHTSSNLWLWLVLIGYALSMVMLGVAGVLHRRKQAQRTRS